MKLKDIRICIICGKWDIFPEKTTIQKKCLKHTYTNLQSYLESKSISQVQVILKMINTNEKS